MNGVKVEYYSPNVGIVPHWDKIQLLVDIYQKREFTEYEMNLLIKPFWGLSP